MAKVGRRGPKKTQILDAARLVEELRANAAYADQGSLRQALNLWAGTSTILRMDPDMVRL